MERIYLDTPVFGGYFDAEFELWTKLLFDKIIEGKYKIIYSELTGIELEDAPEKVVGKTSISDCSHIALATLNNADILVSWNSKHIVNINRIRGYNTVNAMLGHKILEIRSPREILEYEN